jgi:uncharacterized LabA/DUF88 family protein
VALFGGGYRGPPEVHYLFIDGGALRGRLKNICDKYFGGAIVDIDFRKLKGSYTKAFYYDAVPVRNERESEEDYELRIRPNRAVLDAAASTDGMHVYEGDVRRRRRRGLEQKKVDVMLTVDMLTHAFRRNMHNATILTGDGDFKPLIDALVQDGMFVTLWYPVGETSSELMQAADARKKLSMMELHSILTPLSQKVFSIPTAKNESPGAQPGDPISTWNDGEKEYGLYKRDDVFLLTKEHDKNNTLHVRHSNFELLREFCSDTLDIEIPRQVLAGIA